MTPTSHGGQSRSGRRLLPVALAILLLRLVFCGCHSCTNHWPPKGPSSPFNLKRPTLEKASASNHRPQGKPSPTCCTIHLSRQNDQSHLSPEPAETSLVSEHAFLRSLFQHVELWLLHILPQGSAKQSEEPFSCLPLCQPLMYIFPARLLI